MIVVEDRWSRIVKNEHVRPAVLADALAELQARPPSVPLVYCETRSLAEEWTYRFLAAARQWARDEHAISTPRQRPTGSGSALVPLPPRATRQLQSGALR